MKIGIIGAGQIGGTLTRRLTALGHEVFVANSRGPKTLSDLASETGATAVSVPEAVRGVDLVVVTIPEKNVPSLSAGLFANMPDHVVVVDTGNYYPRQRDGRIEEGVEGATIPQGAVAKNEDEWLFNVAADVDGDGDPVEAAKWNPAFGAPALAYVRVTTIARTDRRDLDYLAPLLVKSEDKNFEESPNDVFNTVPERRFRRRQLQTVVDMRNLS